MGIIWLIVLLMLVDGVLSQEDCLKKCAEKYSDDSDISTCKDGCRLAVVFNFVHSGDEASLHEKCRKGCNDSYKEAIEKEICAFGCDNQPLISSGRVEVSISDKDPTFGVVRHQMDNMFSRMAAGFPMLGNDMHPMLMGPSMIMDEEEDMSDPFAMMHRQMQNDMERFRQIAKHLLAMGQQLPNSNDNQMVSNSRPAAHLDSAFNDDGYKVKDDAIRKEIKRNIYYKKRGFIDSSSKGDSLIDNSEKEPVGKSKLSSPPNVFHQPKLFGLPKVPGLPVALERRRLSGLPKAFWPSKIIGFPKALEPPRAPMLPQAFEQPEVFGLPRVSESPRVPGLPRAPEPSKVPGLPRAREQSKIPGLPRAREPSKVPGLPRVSEPPKAFELPMVSGLPKAPEPPKVPKLLRVRGLPKLSGLRKALELLDVSGLSKTSGQPKVHVIFPKGPSVGNKAEDGSTVIKAQPASMNHEHLLGHIGENPNAHEETSWLSRLASRARRLSVLSQWLVCAALLLCLISMLSISVAILKQIRAQKYHNLRGAHIVVPSTFGEPLPAKKVPLESPPNATMDYPLIHDSPPPAYDQLSIHKEKPADES